MALLAAIPVLLLSGYIGAWLLWTWWTVPKIVFNNGTNGNIVIVSPQRTFGVSRVFVPIRQHIAAGRPGSELLAAMRDEVIQRSLPPPAPPPEPQSLVVEEIDRLLIDVPQ